MFSFVWPWMFLLLALPIAVYFLSKKRTVSQALQVRHPSIEQLQHANSASTTLRSKKLYKTAISLIYCALVFALARPQWIDQYQKVSITARDMIIAVDISRSMLEQDMQIDSNRVSRLDMTKSVLSHFIERRKGDRLGLIVFGSNAYVHAPLSFDTHTIKVFLQELQAGFAGNATAIGDAIGLSIKQLKDRPDNQRVVVLLTDGANTAGSLDPKAAAKIAAQHNLVFYTIGIGGSGESNNSLLGKFFNINVHKQTDLDEDTLRSIAEITGGQYYRASSSDELEKIYRELDKREPIAQNDKTSFTVKSLIHLPIIFIFSILLFVFLFDILANRYRMLKDKVH